MALFRMITSPPLARDIQSRKVDEPLLLVRHLTSRQAAQAPLHRPRATQTRHARHLTLEQVVHRPRERMRSVCELEEVEGLLCKARGVSVLCEVGVQVERRNSRGIPVLVYDSQTHMNGFRHMCLVVFTRYKQYLLALEYGERRSWKTTILYGEHLRAFIHDFSPYPHYTTSFSGEVAYSPGKVVALTTFEAHSVDYRRLSSTERAFGAPFLSSRLNAHKEYARIIDTITVITPVQLHS
ncbi:hypothetical protein BC628DRAFT_830665 [Trametes gibbosa]|nr:hypothetical protein BC628DRAFT_830665 [Trametes gibbosa]